MRYLLTDILLQNSGIETTTALPMHPDKVVPDFYCNLISSRDRSLGASGVFVKTHDVFEDLEGRFRGLPQARDAAGPLARNCKHLYLFRAPEDALISLFHYYDRRPQIRPQSVPGTDAFCLERLPAWENNLASYLAAAEKGVPIFFVNYETLLKEPSANLAGVLRWMEIPHDASMVRRAVINMQFSKLRELEVRERLTQDGLSFRKGASGGGRAELQAASMDEIVRRTSGLMERAYRRVVKQAPIGEFPKKDDPLPSDQRTGGLASNHASSASCFQEA
jgi:hypothetical protein